MSTPTGDGRMLRELPEAAGVSLGQFVILTDDSRGHLSKVENGPRPAPITMRAEAPGPRSGGRHGRFPRMTSEPLAVIGMACRYPSGIDSAEALWRAFVERRTIGGSLPTDRGWDLDALRCATDRGGFPDSATEFGAAFSDISPWEATPAWSSAPRPGPTGPGGRSDGDDDTRVRGTERTRQSGSRRPLQSLFRGRGRCGLRPRSGPAQPSRVRHRPRSSAGSCLRPPVAG
jgi:hypothetical protein